RVLGRASPQTSRRRFLHLPLHGSPPVQGVTADFSLSFKLIRASSRIGTLVALLGSRALRKLGDSSIKGNENDQEDTPRRGARGVGPVRSGVVRHVREWGVRGRESERLDGRWRYLVRVA